jgi:hypothetical protein
LPLSYSQSQIKNALEHQESADGLAGVWLAAAQSHLMGTPHSSLFLNLSNSLPPE